IPDYGGWHVLFTKLKSGETSPEIYYGWFNGATLSQRTRLTFNSDFEGFSESWYKNKGIDAAVSTESHRIFVAWIQWNGVNNSTKEAYVGELLVPVKRRIR
ncbi:MAG: hypothetical protein KJ645_14055, partial [Planctomycetes bacterium]|nr:hypothetical protein [Planctomycetota bacterium]